MSFPNAPRRGKDNSRPEHFAYLKGYKGEELYGYLAGPVVWLELHTSDRGSQPCLHLLTGGELSCSKCKYGEPSRKGALGFYHAKDWKPYFVWVDESREDIYAGFRWLAKLKFGREKLKGSPVWAALCLSQHDEFPTTDPRRKKPIDLTESLLRIFADDALTLWYRGSHGLSDRGVSLPKGTAVKDDGEPYSPALQAAAKRHGADVLPPGVRGIETDVDAEFLRGLQDRARKPSKNGKHPPPGE
jgi:hypothetical protein